MKFPAGRQAVNNLVLLGENKLDDPLLLSHYETLGELDCEYEISRHSTLTRLLSSSCCILITASLPNLEFVGVKFSTDWTPLSNGVTQKKYTHSIFLYCSLIWISRCRPRWRGDKRSFLLRANNMLVNLPSSMELTNTDGKHNLGK